MAAEELGKIVSAGYGLKSYLPAHSVFHKKLRLPMCIFADAIRVGRAEAKLYARDWKGERVRCNPRGTR